jgi:DNA polymerase-3 subunit beta
MYFETSRKELLLPLKMITGVVEQRQTLPILANALVRVQGNTLHLIATDGEVEIACSLPLESSLNGDNDGETTIPARKFFDICRSLPESTQLQVDIDENQASVKAGKSKFKLQTLPAEDFPGRPQLQEPTQFSISQQHLKQLISKTYFCVAVNDVRYYLTGLLLELAENKIFLVGTDGHRMAVAQHEFASEQETKVIIPRKAVSELLKLLTDGDEEVTISFDENHIRIEVNQALTLSSKLIDGSFPDWRGVVPQHLDKTVLTDTALLKQALARASILSNEKYKGIRFILAPKMLTLTARNSYQEEAEEIVEVEYEGDELEIGFNGSYIVDVLNVIPTATVQLSFADANSSCLITEEGNEERKYIVMPMRL